MSEQLINHFVVIADEYLNSNTHMRVSRQLLDHFGSVDEYMAAASKKGILCALYESGDVFCTKSVAHAARFVADKLIATFTPKQPARAEEK